MVDVGLRLEADVASSVSGLSSVLPEAWDPDSKRWLSERTDLRAREIPRKLSFGSDYPYREAREHLGVTSSGIGLEPSFAAGGLSNVWGASILPSMDRDLVDWPFGVDRLKPHYEACVRLTGLSGEVDDLNALLPLYTGSPGQLKISRQALSVQRKLERNRESLAKSGLRSGRARLAIRAAREDGPGCHYCGMCLNGCPYGFIYSSDHSIARFRNNERFSYQPDMVVTAVEEASSHVTIRGYNRLTREAISLNAERAFLACGVIPTSAILLRSMSGYNRSVKISDSQYFLLPAMLTSRTAGVSRERLHTLSQLFLEIDDPRISPYSVHMQVYSFSTHIAQVVRRSLGYAAGALGFIARELENRLILLQGYLHSKESSGIALTLRRSTDRDKLDLEPLINPEARNTIHKVARKLLRNSLRLGLVPLPMLLEVAEPGRGFHAGGSFPMRRHPAELETDILGRPRGFQRIHAVDASVLPSIPATTITLTVMANAHRIAIESTSQALHA